MFQATQKVVVRRHLLNAYFTTVFLLGVAFSVAILPRFRLGVYSRKRRCVFMPEIAYWLAYRGLFNYLADMSALRNALMILSVDTLSHDLVDFERLYSFLGNYFLTGMATRFSTFVSWAKRFRRDRQRPPNRRRFDATNWSPHYCELAAKDNSNKVLGGVVLHRYFFRRLGPLTNINISHADVRRDFFLPLSVLSTRERLFEFLVFLLKIHLFYRNRVAAKRFLWEHRFGSHIRCSSMLGGAPRTFSYLFHIYGRQRTKVQNWELAAQLEQFQSFPGRYRQYLRDKTKYDPRD